MKKKKIEDETTAVLVNSFKETVYNLMRGKFVKMFLHPF